MASSPDSGPPTASTSLTTNPVSAPQNTSQIQEQKDELPSSTPVEMSQLDSQSRSKHASFQSATSQPPLSPAAETPMQTPMQHNFPSSDALREDHDSREEPTSAGAQASNPQPAPTLPAPQASSGAIADENRGEQPAPSSSHSARQPLQSPSHKQTDSTPAIGPPAEISDITAASTSDSAVLIALLLTTGSRHPFKIDQKYLEKRNVKSATGQSSPYDISVYTVKELIWKDWREDWEPRPTSPSSIRLIYFGRLLDDKSTLKDCRFTNTATNVVHMTVKPASTDDDDHHVKGRLAASRDGSVAEQNTACCRCCSIM